MVFDLNLRLGVVGESRASSDGAMGVAGERRGSIEEVVEEETSPVPVLCCVGDNWTLWLRRVHDGLEPYDDGGIPGASLSSMGPDCNGDECERCLERPR